MDKIMNNLVEKMANERALWIDTTIKKAVPEWKLNLLKRINHPLIRKVIGVDIEIINETLIVDFGTQVIIKLNNKIIGQRKYTV